MESNNPIRTVVAALAALGGMLATTPALSGDVVASGGWARPTAAGAKEAVAYVVLTNNGDEERKLLRITSPACDVIRLHRSAVDDQGRARLWPVGGLALQPGETLRLEPDGIQLTCDGIAAPFKVGASIPLTLQFDDRAPAITIQLEVRARPPARG